MLKSVIIWEQIISILEGGKFPKYHSQNADANKIKNFSSEKPLAKRGGAIDEKSTSEKPLANRGGEK